MGDTGNRCRQVEAMYGGINSENSFEGYNYYGAMSI